MNRFDEALKRVKKNVEIQDGWTEEDFDHYNTIVFALEIASHLCECILPETEMNDIKCKDCEYLMFSDMYGECSKAYKGIVSPNDSCGKGKLKGGEEE
jgi:hypothetical protein